MKARKAVGAPVPPGPITREQAERPTSEGQVEHIVELMATGQWRAGRSHLALAKAWGVSMHHINDRASEAARFIRISVGKDPEAVRAMFVAELESLCDDARALGRPGDAMRGIEIKAKLLRLVDSSHDKPTPWAAMPPAQRLERIAGARSRLDALEAETRAQMATPADAPALSRGKR